VKTNLRCLVLLVFLASSSTCLANDVITIREAQLFVDKFIAMGNDYDPELSELYSASARIYVKRKASPIETKDMQFSGSQYKALLRIAMPVAKAKGDRSEFEAPHLEHDGNRMRIRMERYSPLRCYWDRSYSFVIEKSSSGALQIVEERISGQGWSECR
jgi:hypothetical protein